MRLFALTTRLMPLAPAMPKHHAWMLRRSAVAALGTVTSKPKSASQQQSFCSSAAGQVKLT